MVEQLVFFTWCWCIQTVMNTGKCFFINNNKIRNKKPPLRPLTGTTTLNKFPFFIDTYARSTNNYSKDEDDHHFEGSIEEKTVSKVVVDV